MGWFRSKKSKPESKPDRNRKVTRKLDIELTEAEWKELDTWVVSWNNCSVPEMLSKWIKNRLHGRGRIGN